MPVSAARRISAWQINFSAEAVKYLSGGARIAEKLSPIVTGYVVATGPRRDRWAARDLKAAQVIELVRQ